MIENLSKENFWDVLNESYPEAVAHFCKWIDEYKKEVNWNDLFNDGNSSGEGQKQAPKFHDLPFEMQNGIIARFELEMFNGQGIQNYKHIVGKYRSQIIKLFEDLQTNIAIWQIK